MSTEERESYRRMAEQLRTIATGKHAQLLLTAAYQIDTLTTVLDQTQARLTDANQDFNTLARDIVAQAKRDQA